MGKIAIMLESDFHADVSADFLGFAIPIHDFERRDATDVFLAIHSGLQVLFGTFKTHEAGRCASVSEAVNHSRLDRSGAMKRNHWWTRVDQFRHERSTLHRCDVDSRAETGDG